MNNTNATIEANIARASALISQCGALGILETTGDYVSVIFDREDGSEPQWVKMTVKDAAKDLASQDAFGVLEDAIENVKAETKKLVEDCFEAGILTEENGVISSPYFMYVEYDRISWSSIDELIQDLLYEPTWKDRVYCYNPRSRGYLKSWYDAYVKTKDFPELHNMLFNFSDDDLLFRSNSEDFAIYYFNPDSSVGGQIVHCPIDFEMANRIAVGEDWIEVAAEVPQYLADINHGSFFDTIEELVDDYRNNKFIGNRDISCMLAEIL